MLQRTYYTNGKNEFKDNSFSSKEWAAPYMVAPKEIKDRLASFQLEGRKIKELKFVGHCYSHIRDFIEDAAYRYLKGYEEEERQRRSEYDNIDPGTPYYRWAELDEPFLIAFEDNDIFEIDTPQEPEFRFSMNSIPWHIEEGVNLRNVDANVLFSTCIGKTIKAVEVNTYHTDKDPMFSTYFDEDHTELELVSSIALRFYDDTCLKIGPHIDFCDVDACDSEDQTEVFTFGELKPGLFNWEDMHIDQVTGYVSDTGHLFFNELGREHVGGPFNIITDENRKFRVCINYEDFLPVDWAISSFQKKPYDVYDDNFFTQEQWNSILTEAERILQFETFDELFDDLTSRNITHERTGVNALMYDLNNYGAKAWKKVSILRNIVKDIREWTNLVFKETGTIKVYGYE